MVKTKRFTLLCTYDKDGGITIFKKNIRYPFVYFVVLTSWQLIINKDIRWIENIIVCFIMYLILLFIHWARIPYK